MNRSTVIGLTETHSYEFSLIRNDGGRRNIDCGFLAVRDAARGMLQRSFLSDSPEIIRKDMVEMFKSLNESERFYVSFTMLTEKQVKAYNDLDPYTAKIEEDVVNAIMNKTMPWEVIVFYIQKKFPDTVNLVVWNHVGKNTFRFALGTELNDELPILHIAHWGRNEHYEAILPLRDAALEMDLKKF